MRIKGQNTHKVLIAVPVTVYVLNVSFYLITIIIIIISFEYEVQKLIEFSPVTSILR
jgi:hypothetical protein